MSSSRKTNDGLDCLGLGIMPLDLLYEVARYPKRGQKIDGLGVSIHGGGPVPNTLAGLQRLGLRTALIAPIGDDLFGRIVVEEQEKQGVDCSYLVYKRGQSLTAIGVIEEDGGTRTMVLNRKIHVQPEDLALDKYPIPQLVHLDGRDLEACIKLARWGKKVGTVRNDVSPIFPLIDHLVVADSYALPFTGKRSARRALDGLRQLCPGTVVITRGVDGQIGWEAGEYVRQAAYRVKSVDQTGAGDAFHAGYIYALLRSMSIADRLRYGSAVAAIKCTCPGGRDGLPTRRQLEKFLKGNAPTYARTAGGAR